MQAEVADFQEGLTYPYDEREPWYEANRQAHLETNHMYPTLTQPIKRVFSQMFASAAANESCWCFNELFRFIMVIGSLAFRWHWHSMTSLGKSLIMKMKLNRIWFSLFYSINVWYCCFCLSVHSSRGRIQHPCMCIWRWRKGISFNVCALIRLVCLWSLNHVFNTT